MRLALGYLEQTTMQDIPQTGGEVKSTQSHLFSVAARWLPTEGLQHLPGAGGWDGNLRSMLSFFEPAGLPEPEGLGDGGKPGVAEARLRCKGAPTKLAKQEPVLQGRVPSLPLATIHAKIWACVK